MLNDEQDRFLEFLMTVFAKYGHLEPCRELLFKYWYSFRAYSYDKIREAFITLWNNKNRPKKMPDIYEVESILKKDFPAPQNKFQVTCKVVDCLLISFLPVGEDKQGNIVKYCHKHYDDFHLARQIAQFDISKNDYLQERLAKGSELFLKWVKQWKEHFKRG